jgi:outer membrane lipoprotein-sorting protein
MTHKWLRWMPAVAVPAVIAAAVLAGSLPASAGDPLPAKTPEQVLAMVVQHSAPSLSGTLEQTSEMGLPALPPLTGPGAGTGAASVLELLSAPHTARVFLDGTGNMRIQVLDRLAERNAVRNGNEVWLYSSKDNTATHLTLPAGVGHSRHKAARVPGVMPTPEELAARFLAAVDPDTEVTVLPEVSVAGRAAYNLMLTPRQEGTLIGSVSIAVDGQSGLPLSVELKARGQAEPAFRLAFTSLALEAPDAALFAFSPPPGATVKELAIPDSPHGTGAADGTDKWPARSRVEHSRVEHSGVEHRTDSSPVPGGKSFPRPAVTGSGWESVVEFQASEATAQAGAMVAEDRLLRQAAVAVPGGRLFSTAVLNVLFTDDGRILAGAVPAERLQTAAAAR